MSAFSYFVETQVGAHLAEFVTAKELAAVGLGHLAEPSGIKLRVGQAIYCTTCREGPDGKAGFVIHAKRGEAKDPPFLQYHASQTWSKCHDQWIGWHEPPEPLDLLRERPTPGAIATDCFGRAWQVPLARMPESQFGSLATYLSADRQGKGVRKLHAFEEKLWSMAESLAPKMLSTEATIENQELLDLALLALGRNYRLSPLELAAFEAMGQPVLDVEFVQAVAMAVCHFDLLQNLQKKT